MLSRGIIIGALVVYLGVFLGCILQRNGSSAIADDNGQPRLVKLEGLPYRGAAMQIQRTDWMDDYKRSIDEIAALGADTVLLIVDARQENGASCKIYLDVRMTPTVDKLGELIDYARGKKLRTILMPIVLLDAPRGNEWRGNIKPELWEAWFNSYRDVIRTYAYVAEEHKLDVLVVGSELVTSETKVDEWRKTIRMVREIYKGQLTYSSNWDHYMEIPFWDQLDLIGMNSYWSLDKGADGHGRKNQVTTQEIAANWREIQKDLAAFSKKKGKPILLLEAGWCSLKNAADEPWDYTRTDLPQDLDLQKRLWEGFFEAWHGTPWMAGFMVWAWSPNDGKPDAAKDYSIKGKPAYEVVKRWMGKPWQE